MDLARIVAGGIGNPEEAGVSFATVTVCTSSEVILVTQTQVV